jgi:hypothetical protein
MLFSNLLNRSILTHPEFSLMISTGFFFLSVYNFLVFPVIYCRSCCLYIANNFWCIPVFCVKLGLYLVILQSLCLLYKLPKCDLLFILHVSFLLLLFFSSILLPLSNFQYRMTGLDWFDIMRVCNNIQISKCSHYTNFSSFFLLSYTQSDDCWFIVETSARSCGLYSYSDNLCWSGKVYFNLLAPELFF